MHHVVVSRVSLGIALLLVAAVAAFGLLVTRTAGPGASGVVTGPGPPAAAQGEVLFRANCARCHDAAGLRGRLAGSADPAGTLEAWRAFLEDHGRGTAEQDRAVIAYLAAAGDGGAP